MVRNSPLQSTEMYQSISVIIPAYNGVPYIADALASICAQTLPPDEVIVVDDASSDGTPERVSSLARTLPVPIRLIRLGRNSGGPPHPLNTGIQASRGNIIAILEQDDLMMSNRLQNQLSALEEHPKGALCIGRCMATGATSEDIPWFVESQFAAIGWRADHPALKSSHVAIGSRLAFTSLIKSNFTVSNSNLCFRKTLWKRIGGFDRSIPTASDWDFALRAALQGPVIITMAFTLQCRWDTNSLHRQDAARHMRDRLRAFAKVARLKPRWITEPMWREWWSIGRTAIRASNRLDAVRIAWMMGWSGALQNRLHAKFQVWKETFTRTENNVP